MVKSKKISKSSIAIIALSMLLVLSMVISLSGAWFTDKDAAEGSLPLDFGEVSVGLSGVSGVFNVDIENDLFLPGDSISLSGTISNETSTVGIYVKFAATATLEQWSANGVDGEKGTADDVWTNIGKMYLADTGAGEALTITALHTDGALAADWTLVDAGKGYYFLAVGAADQSVTGSVTFDPATQNTVYVGETRTATDINGVVETYRIHYTVQVYAVQANHVQSGAVDSAASIAALDVIFAELTLADIQANA